MTLPPDARTTERRVSPRWRCLLGAILWGILGPPIMFGTVMGAGWCAQKAVRWLFGLMPEHTAKMTFVVVIVSAFIGGVILICWQFGSWAYRRCSLSKDYFNE